MDYGELVGTYEELAATQSRLEKTEILATLLKEAERDRLGPVVRLLRGRTFERWESGDLGISSSLTHEAISRATGIEMETIETWWRETGDLGDAAARATQEATQVTLVSGKLTVDLVHDTLRSLADMSGSGSRDRRVGEIAGLLTNAEPLEAKYLVRTVCGAMRLGIGEGILRDAIAWAFLEESETGAAAVQSALDVTNDFGVVARTARDQGRNGLASLEMEVFRPIKPMLAQQAEDLQTAFTELAAPDGTVLLEVKYDGMRAKLHGEGDDYRIYSRRLEDVTAQFPDIERAMADISLDRFVIEAEVVGFDPENERPVPFQELSRRITRKYEIDRLKEEVPVRVFVFDLLYDDNDLLLAEPLRERLRGLNEPIRETQDRLMRADHLVTDDPAEATQFRASALASGHEGIMVKNLDAAYQPGSRVGYQQKVKSTHDPLDLVVTRAKWSEGRKSDFLGRPYLACRDAEGALREVGRMHTGFTDEELETFHGLVEPLIQSLEGREAALRPEVVLEVECAEIQRSTTYDAGYALRFPRLKRIRPDLAVEDIDTLHTVAEMYESQSES